MTSNVKVNQISIFLDILCIVIYLYMYHINAGTCLVKRLPWLHSWMGPHRGLFHFQITWIIYLKVLLFCYQIYLHRVHCDLCVCVLPGRCMLVVTLSVLSLIVDLVSKERKQPIMHLPSWKLFLAANLIICTCTKIVVSRVNWFYHLFESKVWITLSDVWCSVIDGAFLVY